MAQFTVGQQVRVLSPYWSNGLRSNSSIGTGDVGEIEEGPDSAGDYYVKTGDEEGGYVAAHNLEAVEPVKAPIGTATVSIEVRFFIDGTDVTDRIKTLFA